MPQQWILIIDFIWRVTENSCMKSLRSTIFWLSLGHWGGSPWGGLCNRSPFTSYCCCCFSLTMMWYIFWSHYPHGKSTGVETFGMPSDCDDETLLNTIHPCLIGQAKPNQTKKTKNRAKQNKRNKKSNSTVESIIFVRTFIAVFVNGNESPEL